MTVKNQDSVSDGVAPARSVDRLLLDEANHRVANEATTALAALRLARNAKGWRVKLRLIDLAIERLEGFGDCCRLLAAVPHTVVDAGSLLENVCRALVRSRISSGPDRVVLSISELRVPGETAMRIAMIAHELVTNTLKHAFATHKGELEVRLEHLADALVLSVIDDGPGLGIGYGSVTGGTRLGGTIVGELVHSLGGSMECESGPGGTAIHVVIPAPAEHVEITADG